ncbi:WD40 repeat-like protein [Dissophora ornata]|nr:hypothetical protein BGZ58_006319 [Dissophora ornata]KAI8599680.1 WD40 repeat-like protein [Dissophora ornata]
MLSTLTWSKQSSAQDSSSLDMQLRRATDKGQQQKSQLDIGRLPEQDQIIISQIWSLFESAPSNHRQLVLSGLLNRCCVPQLSFLSNHIQPLLRIDFLTLLPAEIGLRILSYLDATSLCHAAQVSKSWKRLADDDLVWQRMCEQHIGLKCTKCGWGLPLLEKKRVRSKRILEQLQQQAQQQLLTEKNHPADHDHDHDHQGDKDAITPYPSPPASAFPSISLAESSPSSEYSSRRRSAPDDDDTETDHAPKRPRYASRSPSPPASGLQDATPLFQSPEPPVKSTETATKRPWKEIYSERLIVERNWRKRNYRTKVFKGHSDGVMCLQFDDSYLITGSYDNTAKVWNIETGECLRTLTGHALCVRALRFDEAKLITGSMDRTLKIWNYHTGQCIRTLQGHTDGVVTLDFDSRILASGSVDSTIKIWDFATGKCTTLKGHSDLVNKVQIYMKTMLFSASDDTTVKLWDIATSTCLRTFTGHVGRVQSLQTSGDALISILANQRHNSRSSAIKSGQRSPSYDSGSSDGETRTTMPVIVTGGLDNTLKVWNAETGECQNTLFGHEGGVWSLAFDKLRIVSGSLDKTVKVWDTESGECLYTLPELDSPVTCVGLGDTRVVGGSANGGVYLWDYGVRP